MNRIIFCVTNDLNYDQRMHRICGTLSAAGYDVWLVGRGKKDSIPLAEKNFRQKRLSCFFSRGFLFYAEYNIRLFLFLLGVKKDVLCAIDLDTILPVYFASRLSGSKRVYDAHELFTEQKEVVSRKTILRFWLGVERFAVPKFRQGYTVNEALAGIFRQRYGVHYEVIPNYPVLGEETVPASPEKFFLYQGAVNEGRCFETLIPAMQHVPARLVICGTGNFLSRAQQLVQDYGLADKIVFRGNLLPDELRQLTLRAHAGIMLFEATGLNQYYSLANRFFDYIMAGLPQLCVNYPLYAAVQAKYDIMLPVADTSIEAIAAGLNELLRNETLYAELRENCLRARLELNWQSVEPALIRFYHQL